MVTIAAGGSGGQPKVQASESKVKLLCSYGGKIQQRPHDERLTYVGGDTKLLAVDRKIKISHIIAKLNSLFSFNCEDVRIKYQLPGEDLDVLISVIDDDDVENMMIEYDRLKKRVSPNKTARLRLFIAPAKKPGKPISDSGSGSPPLNPDYLFGFDKDYQPSTSKHAAVDLSSWTIPTTVEPGKPKSVTRDIDNRNSNGLPGEERAEANQVVYRIPVAPAGFRFWQQYALQAVVPMGFLNGSQQLPVCNAVPSVPFVPEEMKIAVRAVDRACQRRNQ